MSARQGQTTTKNQVIDIRIAAERAGFSIRDFRKVVEEDRIPVKKIAGRTFMTAAAFEEWQETRGQFRLKVALDQVDRWLSTLPADQRWLRVEQRPETTFMFLPADYQI